MQNNELQAKMIWKEDLKSSSKLSSIQLVLSSKDPLSKAKVQNLVQLKLSANENNIERTCKG